MPFILPQTTRAKRRESAANTKPTCRLPYEVMDIIFGHVQKALHLKTLARFVQLNQACYDLAIPKLYETVIVTKDNQEDLTYNQEDLTYGMSGLSGGRFESPTGDAQTRKDIAKTFTRRMLADWAPLSKTVLDAYRGVTEVIVTSRCHDLLPPPKQWPGDRYRDDSSELVPLPPRIHVCIDDLVGFFRFKWATILHVTIQVSNDGFQRLSEALQEPEIRMILLDRWNPITYGFVDMPLNLDQSLKLQTAYAMWGGVQFTTPSGDTLGQHTDTLSLLLCQCLRSETIAPGRLFLCDVPELVLSTEDLAKAGDNVKEVALLKIYDAWPTTHPQPSWDVFNLRVKLVNEGYRRSKEEHAEDMENLTRIDPETLELLPPSP